MSSINLIKLDCFVKFVTKSGFYEKNHIVKLEKQNFQVPLNFNNSKIIIDKTITLCYNIFEIKDKNIKFLTQK